MERCEHCRERDATHQYFPFCGVVCQDRAEQLVRDRPQPPPNSDSGMAPVFFAILLIVVVLFVSCAGC
jgi:hypothetical protein